MWYHGAILYAHYFILFLCLFTRTLIYVCIYIYICLCVYVEYPSYCPILTGNVPFSADGGVGLGHRLEIGQDDSGWGTQMVGRFWFVLCAPASDLCWFRQWKNSDLMWSKQFKKKRHPQIAIFLGGINQPFPVMAGKNGIGLSTLGISWDFTGDFSWD